MGNGEGKGRRKRCGGEGERDVEGELGCLSARPDDGKGH